MPRTALALVADQPKPNIRPDTASLLAQYIASSKVPTTQANRRFAVGCFVNWLGDMPLASADPVLMERYDLHLQAAGKKPGTVTAYVRAALHFLKFASRRGVIRDPLLDEIHPGKADLPLDAALTPEQKAALFTVCLAVWERLALRLLVEGGLRASGFGALTWQHFETAPDGQIIVQVFEKGSETRTVDFPNGFGDLLKLWRESNPGLQVFPMLADRHKLWRWVDRLGRRAKERYPKLFEFTNLYPHLFRATMITEMCAQEQPVAAQLRAGHKRPETTARYNRMSKSKRTYCLEDASKGAEDA